MRAMRVRRRRTGPAGDEPLPAREKRASRYLTMTAQPRTISTTVLGSAFTVSHAGPHSTTRLRSSPPAESFANCQPSAPDSPGRVSCAKQVGWPPLVVYCTLTLLVETVGTAN